jgi:hypothetical protein
VPSWDVKGIQTLFQNKKNSKNDKEDDKLYRKEKEMYPHVCSWLEKVLRNKFKKAKILVAETSRKVLSKWLFEKGCHKCLKDYSTYEIEVDITGIIESEKTELVFVECKLNKITLRDVSQLLGYSKVAIPSLSIILSPMGISESMNLLLNISRRNDILYYTSNKHIIIGKWDSRKREIIPSSIIPKGCHI